MQINFLISDFPNGLTTEFVVELNKYIPDNPTFVFIASDFSQPTRTQYYLDILIKSFNNKGFVFKSVNTIDHHITPIDAQILVNKADIVWIAGGPTLKQIEYIKSYNLIPSLVGRNGITIGMSAGAINMAKRVIHIDESDETNNYDTYDGIGLVDVNIEPHLNCASINHVNNIKKISEFEDIIGLYDNSFIVISDKNQEIFGPYIRFKK